MDIKDMGYESVDFWIESKKELIDILLNKIKAKKSSFSQQGRKILNIGCGTADDLEVLLKYGEVTLIDNNPDVINRSDKYKHVKKHVMDARSLKFKRKII